MKNNLEEAFKNDPEKYRDVLAQLKKELYSYHLHVESLYSAKNYIELKTVSHKIRNIAGMLGFYSLKILASYWEEICAEEKKGDIAEYKACIITAAEAIIIE